LKKSGNILNKITTAKSMKIVAALDIPISAVGE
jgi:hypothetical protein